MSGDYISREAVLNEAEKVSLRERNYRTYGTVVRSIPAADVVEVVSCADCKYDERCMFQDFVRENRVEPYDKTVFFCADGKHKDGGQDDV